MHHLPKAVYQQSTGSHSWEWLLTSKVRLQQISTIYSFSKAFWAMDTEDKVRLQTMGGHSRLTSTKWLRLLNVFSAHDSSSYPHAQPSLPKHRVVASQCFIIPGTDWALKSNKKKKSTQGPDPGRISTPWCLKTAFPMSNVELSPSWLQFPEGFTCSLV